MAELTIGDAALPLPLMSDPDGRIAGAWYNVSPADTVPSLMAALE